MHTSYKVVGRYTGREPSYYCIDPRKIGTQAKKHVYVSETSFKKYSPTLIECWKKIGWDIEIYIMDETDTWIRIDNASNP